MLCCGAKNVVNLFAISDIKSELGRGGGIRAAASTKIRFCEIQRLSEGFAKNHRRVNMAKKKFLGTVLRTVGMLAMALAFGMTVIGCASRGVRTIHQDPSISWQEHALLLPSGNARGIVYVYGLYDQKSFLARTIDANEVGLIPPGTQTINVVTTDVGYENSRPFQMTYEFLPGQRYVIAVVKNRRGLLAGAFSAEIHTVDEYRAIYGEIYPNDDGSGFKRWVLDRFDKAEAELRTNGT
jgi:hypothetical protein